MTTQYKNLINGELVDNGDKWIDVVNPATEQVIGQVPDCGQAELDKAVAAARAAFPAWKTTSVEDRRALLCENGGQRSRKTATN
jgi:acyl-CoA reductase-like NAD-dependent aldehyde dehydrogenase